MYTCQNDSCKRSFDKPLKAVDLRANPTEPFEACPFCLSRIEVTAETVSSSSGERVPKSSERNVSCSRHFGYLCEREEKDGIPDECVLCADVVACMMHSIQR